MTKQQLSEHTIAVWQPRLRRRLTHEDAREIVENITGFFTTLAKWSCEEQRRGPAMKVKGEGDT